MKTAKRAYWLSFVFGLTISFVDVRTLSGLVEPTELDGLEKMQHTLFSFVDVVLTGGVIGGGSVAIDKLGRRLSGYFELNSASASKDSTKSA